LNTGPSRRSTGMLDANVREHDPSAGATVVPLFPPLSAGCAEPKCPVCNRPVRTKRPANVCSPRCRASASRRRRVEAALANLDAGEAALLSVLAVIRQLRAVVISRGTP